MYQMQMRLADESAEPTERDAWLQCFHETISEHIKSIRRIDPSPNDTSRIQEELKQLLPSDSTSGEMVTMMQQYSDFIISMVHKKMGEPK